MLVTGKRLRRRIKDQDPGKLEVVTDIAEIEQVASHKLFGLIIDKNLTDEINFDELCNKFSERLGLLLRHISPYLKKNQKIIYLRESSFNMTRGEG